MKLRLLACLLLSPLAAQAQSDLRDPDPSAFGSDQVRPLLADRQQPSAYPNLDAPDSEGGPINGADARDTKREAGRAREAQAIISAIADMNCRIAERDVADRLGPMGFDPETVTRTLSTLYIQGVAGMDAQGYLTLPAALCPPQTRTDSPRDTVLAAFRANNCTTTEDQMEAAPGISDLSEAQLLAILTHMRDRGEIETGTLQATLSPAICQED